MDLGIYIQQDNKTTEKLNSERGPEYYLQIARLCDENGFHSFWQPDHWMLPRNSATFDCWSLLAAIAGVTRRIVLGSLVTPVVGYHPLTLLKRIQLVQHLSDDRVIFGVGAGWYSQEFRSFGGKFETHRVRMEMLEEALQLFRLASETDGPIYFEGKRYSARGALLEPRIRIPPIWLGGSSETLLSLTARFGDGWIPYEMSADAYAKALQSLERSTEAAGRAPSRIRKGLAGRIVARRSAEEAEMVLESQGLKRDFISTTGQEGHIIAGNYEQCAESLSRYAELGVDTFVLSALPTDASIDLIVSLKDEVISRIK